MLNMFIRERDVEKNLNPTKSNVDEHKHPILNFLRNKNSSRKSGTSLIKNNNFCEDSEQKINAPTEHSPSQQSISSASTEYLDSLSSMQSLTLDNSQIDITNEDKIKLEIEELQKLKNTISEQANIHLKTFLKQTNFNQAMYQYCMKSKFCLSDALNFIVQRYNYVIENYLHYSTRQSNICLRKPILIICDLLKQSVGMCDRVWPLIIQDYYNYADKVNLCYYTYHLKFAHNLEQSIEKVIAINKKISEKKSSISKIVPTQISPMDFSLILHMRDVPLNRKIIRPNKNSL